MEVNQMQYEESQPLPEPMGEEEENSIEIEVVDDTPLEDQNRDRPVGESLDTESDEFKQEVNNYSEKAQQRINTLTHARHEERRQKETAERQAAEAIRYAEQVTRDNQALKQSLDQTNSTLIEQYGERTTAELAQAEQKFRTAYDEGDTDKLVEAQKEMATLHARQAAISQTQPARQQYQQPQQLQQPFVDHKFAEWHRNNQWFQRPGDEDMTGFAIGLHQKLVQQGIDPITDERYYTEIDEGMRKVFPDRFGDRNQGSTGQDGVIVATKSDAPAATVTKQPPVGGPSRGGSPPRKVQLTSTQVSLAKRLGLTLEQYASQVMKEEQQNG